MKERGEDCAGVGMCGEDYIGSELLYVLPQFLHPEFSDTFYQALDSPFGAVKGTEDVFLYERDSEHQAPCFLVQSFHPSEVKIVEEVNQSGFDTDCLKLLAYCASRNEMAFSRLDVDA